MVSILYFSCEAEYAVLVNSVHVCVCVVTAGNRFIYSYTWHSYKLEHFCSRLDVYTHIPDIASVQ